MHLGDVTLLARILEYAVETISNLSDTDREKYGQMYFGHDLKMK